MAIQTILVLGAGQMGSGIAQVCAQHGRRVLLSDASAELAERGKNRIAALLGERVARGKLAADERERVLSHIAVAGTASEFKAADFVIEAAPEEPALKEALFRRVDEATAPEVCIASNTSSISISRLASVTRRPERVVGMHFMNPVPIMQLVEVVRGIQTSPETLSLTVELAQALGKVVIQSDDRPGFLVNRMLVPFLNEACFALQEGVGRAEDIDQGAKLGLNHPMGPLELADLIGLDTLLAIGEVLHRDFGDDKYRAPALLKNLVAAGWLGKKSGRGFYVYENGKRGAPTVRPRG